MDWRALIAALCVICIDLSSQQQYVRCKGDGDCAAHGDRNKCVPEGEHNLNAGYCVECREDGHCSNRGPRKFCQIYDKSDIGTLHTCVECISVFSEEDPTQVVNAFTWPGNAQNMQKGCLNNDVLNPKNPGAVKIKDMPRKIVCNRGTCEECSIDNHCFMFNFEPTTQTRWFGGLLADFHGKTICKVRNNAENICVAPDSPELECTNRKDCAGTSLKACAVDAADPAKRKCAECENNDDCAHNSDKRVCDTTQWKCVACSDDNDCFNLHDADKVRCDTHVCVGCDDSAQCAAYSTRYGVDKRTCDNQKCVECSDDNQGTGWSTDTTQNPTCSIYVADYERDVSCANKLDRPYCVGGTCVKCLKQKLSDLTPGTTLAEVCTADQPKYTKDVGCTESPSGNCADDQLSCFKCRSADYNPYNANAWTGDYGCETEAKKVCSGNSACVLCERSPITNPMTTHVDKGCGLAPLVFGQIRGVTDNLCVAPDRCGQCRDTAGGDIVDQGCTAVTPFCISGYCYECETDAYCAAHFPGKPVCDGHACWACKLQAHGDTTAPGCPEGKICKISNPGANTESRECSYCHDAVAQNDLLGHLQLYRDNAIGQANLAKLNSAEGCSLDSPYCIEIGANPTCKECACADGASNVCDVGCVNAGETARSGVKDVCQNQECVDCNGNVGCDTTSALRTCENNVCVECTVDSDCTTDPKRQCVQWKGVKRCQVCDPVTNEGCPTNEHCVQPEDSAETRCIACDASSCGSGQCDEQSGLCVECLSHQHCAAAFPNDPGKQKCASDNTCKQCVRTADCPDPDVCRTSGDCGPCQQDADCDYPLVCILGGAGGGGGGARSVCLPCRANYNEDQMEQKLLVELVEYRGCSYKKPVCDADHQCHGCDELPTVEQGGCDTAGRWLCRSGEQATKHAVVENKVLSPGMCVKCFQEFTTTQGGQAVKYYNYQCGDKVCWMGSCWPCKEHSSCRDPAKSQCVLKTTNGVPDNECAPCQDDTHCKHIPGRPRCGPSNQCVPCLSYDPDRPNNNHDVGCWRPAIDRDSDWHWLTYQLPVCDVDALECVTCDNSVPSVACNDPLFSRCVRYECKKCMNDNHCSHLPATPICHRPDDQYEGECRACNDQDVIARRTARYSDDWAALRDETCANYGKVCVKTGPNAGQCVQCESDQHCKLHHLDRIKCTDNVCVHCDPNAATPTDDGCDDPLVCRDVNAQRLHGPQPQYRCVECAEQKDCAGGHMVCDKSQFKCTNCGFDEAIMCDYYVYPTCKQLAFVQETKEYYACEHNPTDVNAFGTARNEGYCKMYCTGCTEDRQCYWMPDDRKICNKDAARPNNGEGQTIHVAGGTGAILEISHSDYEAASEKLSTGFRFADYGWCVQCMSNLHCAKRDRPKCSYQEPMVPDGKCLVCTDDHDCVRTAEEVAEYAKKNIKWPYQYCALPDDAQNPTKQCVECNTVHPCARADAVLCVHGICHACLVDAQCEAAPLTPAAPQCRDGKCVVCTGSYPEDKTVCTADRPACVLGKCEKCAPRDIHGQYNVGCEPGLICEEDLETCSACQTSTQCLDPTRRVCGGVGQAVKCVQCVPNDITQGLYNVGCGTGQVCNMNNTCGPCEQPRFDNQTNDIINMGSTCQDPSLDECVNGVCQKRVVEQSEYVVDEDGVALTTAKPVSTTWKHVTGKSVATIKPKVMIGTDSGPRGMALLGEKCSVERNALQLDPLTVCIPGLSCSFGECSMTTCTADRDCPSGFFCGATEHTTWQYGFCLKDAASHGLAHHLLLLVAVVIWAAAN